jgi:Mg2+/Co2+ transporter CorB
LDPTTTASDILDLTFWITVAVIVLLIMMSAFFSGSETALTASSRGKLRAQADKGSRGAEVALHVTEDSERMIGAILLGNNVVNILSASLATALLTRIFGDSGVALATLGMTALVLIFGEVLPKTISILNPEPIATRVAPLIRLLILFLSPIVTVVRAIVRGSSASAPAPTPISSPCARKSRARSRSAMPKAWSRKRTATASSARSTSACARWTKSCATAPRSR